MYCQNCGANLEPGATFCPECGTLIGSPVKKEETNICAILGLIFSLVSVPGFALFVFSVAGLVLSVIGLIKANRYGLGQKGLAIAGIVVSVITIILFVVAAGFVLSMLSELGRWGYYFY